MSFFPRLMLATQLTTRRITGRFSQWMWAMEGVHQEKYGSLSVQISETSFGTLSPRFRRELLRRKQQRCLLEDQGDGRRSCEQRIESLTETLGAVIPVGQVVGTGLDTVGLEFLEKEALKLSQLRQPPAQPKSALKFQVELFVRIYLIFTPSKKPWY